MNDYLLLELLHSLRLHLQLLLGGVVCDLELDVLVSDLLKFLLLGLQLGNDLLELGNLIALLQQLRNVVLVFNLQ